MSEQNNVAAKIWADAFEAWDESRNGFSPGGDDAPAIAVIATALAAQQPQPNPEPMGEGKVAGGVRQRYRHNKRGTEYDLIGIAELQDAKGDGVEEGALLVIYSGDDGKIWARRHSEFGDGRFTRIDASLTPPPTSVDRKAVLEEELVEAIFHNGPVRVGVIGDTLAWEDVHGTWHALAQQEPTP